MGSHRGRKTYTQPCATPLTEITIDRLSAIDQLELDNAAKGDHKYRFKPPNTPCGWSTEWRPMLECTCGHEWTQAIGSDATCPQCKRTGVQAENITGGLCFEQLGRCSYGCTQSCNRPKPKAIKTTGKDTTPVLVALAHSLAKDAPQATLAARKPIHPPLKPLGQPVPVRSTRYTDTAPMVPKRMADGTYSY